ncbi:PilZ domain-containing protein [Oceanisphaera sp.]|uniref:PilZ domain-containing protein n=1 Tax=Oceanisphaera sp. TaxID=1929979 RepID=UPI003A927677
MKPGNGEQRSLQRMRLDTKIILATTQARIEGVCRNLSARGALMEVTAGRCKLGEKWRLVMPSADKSVEPLRALATVLRIERGVATDRVALCLSEVR